MNLEPGIRNLEHEILLLSLLRKLRKIWLKPTKMLIINCHDLKVVAIQGADIPGFSQILSFIPIFRSGLIIEIFYRYYFGAIFRRKKAINPKMIFGIHTAGSAGKSPKVANTVKTCMNKI